MSMSAADWLDMPDRIDREVKVQIPDAARAKYDQLERDLLLPFALAEGMLQQILWLFCQTS